MDSSLFPIILVVCLAGFVHGVTGFGFALVAIPLLPLLMNLKEAVPLVVLLVLIASGIKLFTVWSHYSWRLGLGLVMGCCVGVPLGVYVLIRLDETLLRHMLGGVMLLSGLNDLLVFRKESWRIPPCLGFSLGVASGGLAGAFNMGGPPAVMFVYSQPWNKEQIAAVLQLTFGLSTLLRLILFGWTGLLDSHVLRLAAWSLVPAILAILAGSFWSARVSSVELKRGVAIFLVGMGIKYSLCG